MYLVRGPWLRSGDRLTLLKVNTSFPQSSVCNAANMGRMVLPLVDLPDNSAGLPLWPLSVPSIGFYKVCYYTAFPVDTWEPVTADRSLLFAPLLHPETLSVELYNYSNAATVAPSSEEDVTALGMRQQIYVRSGVLSSLAFGVNGSNYTDFVGLVLDDCVTGLQLMVLNISAAVLNDATLTTAPTMLRFAGDVVVCYRGFPLKLIIPFRVSNLTLVGHGESYNCSSCNATAASGGPARPFARYAGQGLNLTIAGFGFNGTDRLFLAVQGTDCATNISEAALLITNNGSTSEFSIVGVLGIGEEMLAVFPPQRLPGAYDVCYISGFARGSGGGRWSAGDRRVERIAGPGIVVSPIAPEHVAPHHATFCEGTVMALNITGFGLDGARDRAGVSLMNVPDVCNASNAKSTVMLRFDTATSLWMGQLPLIGLLEGPAVLCYYADGYTAAAPTVASAGIVPVTRVFTGAVVPPPLVLHLSYSFSTDFYLNDAVSPFYSASTGKVIEWTVANATVGATEGDAAASAADGSADGGSGVLLTVLPCVTNISSTWITPGLCNSPEVPRRRARQVLTPHQGVFTVDRPGLWHFCTSIPIINQTTGKPGERILDSSINAAGNVIAAYPQKATHLAPNRAAVGLTSTFRVQGSRNVNLAGQPASADGKVAAVLPNAYVAFCMENPTPTPAPTVNEFAEYFSSSSLDSAVHNAKLYIPLAEANGTLTSSLQIHNATAFAFVPAARGYLFVCVFSTPTLSEFYPFYPPITKTIAVPRVLLGGPFHIETFASGTGMTADRSVLLVQQQWLTVRVFGFAFAPFQRLDGLLRMCSGAPGLIVQPLGIAPTDRIEDSDTLLKYNVSFAYAGVYDLCHALAAPSSSVRVFVDDHVWRMQGSAAAGLGGAEAGNTLEWFGVVGDATRVALRGSFTAASAANVTVFLNASLNSDGQCDGASIAALTRQPAVSILLLSNAEEDSSLNVELALNVSVALPAFRGRFALCYTSFSGIARLVQGPPIVAVPGLQAPQTAQQRQGGAVVVSPADAVYASCAATLRVHGYDLRGTDHYFLVLADVGGDRACSSNRLASALPAHLVNLTVSQTVSQQQHQRALTEILLQGNVGAAEAPWTLCYLPLDHLALSVNNSHLPPPRAVQSFPNADRLLGAEVPQLFTAVSPVALRYTSFAGPFVVADACGRPMRSFSIQVLPSEHAIPLLLLPAPGAPNVSLAVFPIATSVILRNSDGFMKEVSVPYRVDVCRLVLAAKPYSRTTIASGQQYAETLFALYNAARLPCTDPAVAQDALRHIVVLLSRNTTANSDPTTLADVTTQVLSTEGGGGVVVADLTPVEAETLLRQGATPTPYTPLPAAEQEKLVNLIGLVLARAPAASFGTPAVIAAAFEALASIATTMCALNQSLTVVSSASGGVTLSAFASRDPMLRGATLPITVGVVETEVVGVGAVFAERPLCVVAVSTRDAALVEILGSVEGGDSNNKLQRTPSAAAAQRRFAALEEDAPPLRLPIVYMAANPFSAPFGPQLAIYGKVRMQLQPAQVPAYTTNISGSVVRYDSALRRWRKLSDASSTVAGNIATSVVTFSVPLTAQPSFVSATVGFTVNRPQPPITPRPTSAPVEIDWWLLITTALLAGTTLLALGIGIVYERRHDALLDTVGGCGGHPGMLTAKISLFSVCAHKVLVLRSRPLWHPVGYAPRVAHAFTLLFCALGAAIVAVAAYGTQDDSMAFLTAARGLPLSVAVLALGSCMAAVVRVLLFRQTWDYASLTGGVLGTAAGVGAAFATRRNPTLSCLLLAGVSASVGALGFFVVRVCLTSTTTFFVSAEPQYIARIFGWCLFTVLVTVTSALGFHFSTSATLADPARSEHLVTFALLWCLVLDLVVLEPVKHAVMRWAVRRRELAMEQPLRSVVSLAARATARIRPPTMPGGQPGQAVLDPYATPPPSDDGDGRGSDDHMQDLEEYERHTTTEDDTLFPEEATSSGTGGVGKRSFARQGPRARVAKPDAGLYNSIASPRKALRDTALEKGTTAGSSALDTEEDDVLASSGASGNVWAAVDDSPREPVAAADAAGPGKRQPPTRKPFGVMPPTFPRAAPSASVSRWVRDQRHSSSSLSLDDDGDDRNSSSSGRAPGAFPSPKKHLSMKALNLLQATMGGRHEPLASGSASLPRDAAAVVELASSTDFETVSSDMFEDGDPDRMSDYNDVDVGTSSPFASGRPADKELLRSGGGADVSVRPDDLYAASPSPRRPPLAAGRQQHEPTASSFAAGHSSPTAAKATAGGVRRFQLLQASSVPLRANTLEASPWSGAAPALVAKAAESDDFEEDWQGTIEVVVDVPAEEQHPNNPIEQQFSLSMPRSASHREPSSSAATRRFSFRPT